MKINTAIPDKVSFPVWLRKSIPLKGKRIIVEKYLQEEVLHTVCEEAKCPNRSECFSRGTATFLIMGSVCTRDCLFCSVKHGTPKPLLKSEPERVCNVIEKLGLSYVVLTSVTRDDLEDGGAAHIAGTVSFLKQNLLDVKVEVLAPDFRGSIRDLKTVLDSGPDVYNHNIETVHRIFLRIRPQADYKSSLKILKHAAGNNSNIPVKSGFMVGLGETEDEVVALMQDLSNSNVSMLTIGQYLRPSSRQVEVKEFIPPEKFDHYADIARKLGFSQVHSGPFVRSSYMADKFF